MALVICLVLRTPLMRLRISFKLGMTALSFASLGCGPSLRLGLVAGLEAPDLFEELLLEVALVELLLLGAVAHDLGEQLGLVGEEVIGERAHEALDVAELEIVEEALG